MFIKNTFLFCVIRQELQLITFILPNQEWLNPSLHQLWMRLCIGPRRGGRTDLDVKGYENNVSLILERVNNTYEAIKTGMHTKNIISSVWLKGSEHAIFGIIWEYLNEYSVYFSDDTGPKNADIDEQCRNSDSKKIQ
eukprot:21838_1